MPDRKQTVAEKVGRRKLVLRKRRGGCGMIDQISVVMSETQEGDVERQGRRFILNYIYIYILPPRTEKNGDANGRKGIFG